MIIPFFNLENVWDLSDTSIPEMFIPGETVQFERTTELLVNLEQQIQLANLLVPIKLGK